MPQNDNVMDVTGDPEKKVGIQEIGCFRRDWKTSLYGLRRDERILEEISMAYFTFIVTLKEWSMDGTPFSDLP